MKYLLGIDNGGTLTKGALFGEDGQQISVVSLPTEMISPRPGFCERDMEALWQVNVEVIRQLMADSGVAAEAIAAVSFSGHGKGLYLMGKEDQVIYNGILSTDTRAWSLVKEWEDSGIADAVYKKTFQKVLPCQPVSLLAWLKLHEPEVYDNIGAIFSVKDYIRYRLTGQAYGEYTDFSGANLVNLRTKQYDKELMALFGLEDLMDRLPALRYSADPCGKITEEASRLTGLNEGTLVAAGMFDVDACGIASGLVTEEAMCMIAGTWSINEFIAQAPIRDHSVDLNSMYCMPGYYLIEESSPTSAGNLEWFIKHLLEEEEKAYHEKETSIYDLTEAWVEALEPQDCDVYFLPFLNGSNESPMAKASFIGLTAYHGRAHMLRAVYEGIVFSHLTHVNKLLKHRDRPSSIRLAGGAAKSKTWVQIFADVLQVPVDLIEDKELGAQGAAMAGGIAAGIYKDYQDAFLRTVKITNTIQPRPAYAAVYQKKYQVYRSINHALDQVWDLI